MAWSKRSRSRALETITTERATGLVWALKDSFVAYAERAGGRVELGGGAGRMPGSGPFYFPLSDADGFDHVRVTGTLRFSGRLRLVGHRGLMDVAIVNPWLHVAEKHGRLSVRDLRSGAPEGARIDLVAVALPVPTCDGSTLMWAGSSTDLSATATHVFAESYDAGQSFASLSVRVPWSPGPSQGDTTG